MITGMVAVPIIPLGTSLSFSHLTPSTPRPVRDSHASAACSWRGDNSQERSCWLGLMCPRREKIGGGLRGRLLTID